MLKKRIFRGVIHNTRPNPEIQKMLIWMTLMKEKRVLKTVASMRMALDQRRKRSLRDSGALIILLAI
jgi:hypothetical protein